MNIMKRINELCKLHRMSKYRLSQITGISQSAFSKMARQQTALSVDTIHRLCEAFGISMAQFFSEQETYPDLTSQQKCLLDKWGKLNKSQQEFILLMTEKLYEVGDVDKTE